MMRKLCFVLLFNLILGSLLFSQNLELTTFVDYYGGIEGTIGYENLRSRVYVSPKLSGTHEKSGLEWLISAHLWIQPLGDHYSIDPWDILGETYLFLPFNFFDITVGQKTITYGFSDIFGPLNVLHSSHKTNYSLDDPYDSRRPDPLVQIRFYPTFEDTIELTYVPLTRPDKERSDSILLPTSLNTLSWSTVPYILEAPHSFFINYSHYGEKLDLQLFYGWYAENTPDFKVIETSSLINSEIETVYRKKHTFGVAYSTRIWSATLSQDLAFNFTSDITGTDIGAQNSDITLNTQLLLNLPLGILSQYTIVYSFFINHNQHNPGSDITASSYLASEIQGFHTQPKQHIAFIVAHFEKSFFREKLKTQLNIGFFFSPEMYFGPRLAYNISDHFTVETGADITLGAPPQKDLRRNPSNDNFYFRTLFRY